MSNQRFTRLIGVLAAVWLAGCGALPFAAPTATPVPPTLRMYGWADDLDPALLTAFTAETGIPVEYVAYDDQFQALEAIQNGDVYDLITLDNDMVTRAIQAELVAPLNHQQLPNLRNIATTFRDLAYDPANRYSTPFNYGVYSLIVNTQAFDDGVATPSAWADLWRDDVSGPVVLWATPRYVMGFALRSLSYSINTEDPAEIEAAKQHLLAISDKLRFVVDYNANSIGPYLAAQNAPLGAGYARDALDARTLVGADFIEPAEGLILWGDNFLIPANSPNQAQAHALLNFLLRPESGAQMVAWNQYATPNDAARPLIDEAFRDDAIIFPSREALLRAEILLPISAEAEALYDAAWEEVLAAVEVVENVEAPAS